jgi:ribosome-binding ATPase YchF (GTP1/OBG family)
MEVGIMGLTASGKSSLFGLLTGQDTSAPWRSPDRHREGP